MYYLLHYIFTAGSFYWIPNWFYFKLILIELFQYKSSFIKNYLTYFVTFLLLLPLSYTEEINFCNSKEFIWRTNKQFLSNHPPFRHSWIHLLTDKEVAPTPKLIFTPHQSSSEMRLKKVLQVKLSSSNIRNRALIPPTQNGSNGLSSWTSQCWSTAWCFLCTGSPKFTK